MAPALTAPPDVAAAGHEQVKERRERPPYGAGAARRWTLAQLLDAAQAELAAASATECPVCGGTMRRHGLDGRCDGCGARLA